DTVIISAKPIPGNELRVHDAINRLARSGAEVLHEDNAPVHVSGHARAEELRTMIGLLRPRAVMPVHGEFRMLAAHAQLAREGGVDSIVMAENGTVVELADGKARIVDRVPAGMTFVDGLGVGDVHDVALRDRRRLAEDGIVIIVATLAASNGSGALTAPPELIVRGFGENAEPLLDELRTEAARVLEELLRDDVTEIKLLQEHLHDALGGIVYDRTRSRRCAGQQTAWRPRSRAWRSRSTATCSSSRRTRWKGGRGTEGQGRRSCSTGSRSSTGPACASRRSASRRRTSSWPCSCARSKGSRTRRASSSCPTAPFSGRASSTCARTCSAARSTTSAS